MEETYQALLDLQDLDARLAEAKDQVRRLTEAAEFDRKLLGSTDE